MVSSVIRQAYGFVIGLELALKRILRLCAVLVHFDRSIVNFGHGDHFNMVTKASLLSLAAYVSIYVFGHVLFEIVGIFGLKSNRIIDY